ncbi:hypothetical protein BDP27DRAFT_1244635 [Rhodocollybia butyracea]|uniref:Uncharacterized protein n=1 Tax=Rhodocollybia butyracea TaxID=206335 RepID=A0A9P5P2T7_9AGAR|nr:hypothetical protein BDP27DRAFT_1244635 [Rhodocollybia butyracea]
MPLCPADCGRWFDFDRGLNSHLNQSRSCAWYRSAQKLAAINNFTAQLDQEDLEIHGADPPAEISNGEAGELLQEIEEEHDIFYFIPLEEPPLGQAAEDLKLFEVEHPTAGACIRMDESLYERWRASHDFSNDSPMDGSSDKPNIYTPFASEMDWRIADWVVKDNIGHSSLNRLLAVPRAVEKLGLSYKNIAGLHKYVDSIRPRAGKWNVRRLAFVDHPDEEFILRHCDVVEVIRSLWGDPSLAKHLVYRPKSIFQDKDNKQRTYSEMWTGKWWQFTQVRLNTLVIYLYLLFLGQTSKRVYCSPAHCRNRQNPAHSIFRQQTGLSCLSDSRQHSPGSSTQTVTASLRPPCLPASREA